MTKREMTLPYVDPSLAGVPAAQGYAQGLAQRRGAVPLPRYNTPVAGGANPPMPRLDQPHRDGMTMADQAAEALFPQPTSAEPSTGFYQGPTMHRTAAATSSGMPLMPTDLLPEQATQDPEYQQGAGSRYAINQPRLAAKYGVIRNGQYLSPQQTQTGRPGLSPQSIEALKTLQQLQQQPPPRVEEKEAVTGTGSSAARLANAPGDDDINPVTDEDREKIKKSLENMDEFDFNTFRNMMVKDILNNEEQRKIIEERLIPIDVTDLILHGMARQVVPIIPGKFEPEFQTVSAEQALALKRLIVLEAKSLDVGDRYLLDKHSFMELAAGIYSINKKPLPSQFDRDGNFQDELFLKKFNLVIKYPLHMLSSLGINYFWFELRVRRLFKTENIKNG